jgi:hypothetical protein
VCGQRCEDSVRTHGRQQAAQAAGKHESRGRPKPRASGPVGSRDASRLEVGSTRRRPEGSAQKHQPGGGRRDGTGQEDPGEPKPGEQCRQRRAEECWHPVDRDQQAVAGQLGACLDSLRTQGHARGTAEAVAEPENRDQRGELP